MRFDVCENYPKWEVVDTARQVVVAELWAESNARIFCEELNEQAGAGE